MARSFNGSNQYLGVSSAVIDVGNLPFTMACWFRVADVTNTYALMTISSSATDDSFVTLQSRGIEAGDPVYVIYEQDYPANTGRVGTSTSVTANTWSHACAVCESTSSRSVFLNGGGKQTNTTSVITTNASNQTTIGALRRSGIIQYLNGQVAYPCIWNVALSDVEVLSLARGVHPSLVRPEAIVALWDLTGTGSPEPDRFGGYNLTLENSPTVVDNPRILLPSRSRLIRLPSGGGFQPAWASQRSHIIGAGV